jgi:hypothetical protein
LYNSLPAKSKSPGKVSFVSDINSVESLQRFADEAECLNKYELAEKYYLDRIAKENSNPSFW